MYKVALYGAQISRFQNAVYKLNLMNVQIEYVIDDDHNALYEIYTRYGIKCCTTNSININDIDYLIVTTSLNYTEIKESLISKGVPDAIIKPLIDEQVQNYSAHFLNGISEYDERDLEILYIKPWVVKKEIELINKKWKDYNDSVPNGMNNFAEHIIAHAGGSVAEKYGKEINCFMSNSKEAFIKSINDGMSLIELDFNYVYDNDVFASHDNFLLLSNSKFGISPLSFGFALDTLIEFKNVKIIIDTWWQTHDDFERIVYEMHKICEKKSEMLGTPIAEQLRQRVVFEVYDEDTIKVIEKYGYPMMLTLYRKQHKTDFIGSINQCINHKIGNIAIKNEDVIKHKKSISLFNKKGINVFCHTIDDYEKYSYLRDIGVHGIFSNYIRKESNG